MSVGGHRQASTKLHSGKTRYPLYRRVGRQQGWAGRVWENSPPPGFDPGNAQIVASHYIDSYSDKQGYFGNVYKR